MARGSDQKLPCGRPLLLSESMETAIDAIFASHARSDWPLPASDLPIIAREIAASFGIQRFKACSDWCAPFMKRHPSLSIRVPRCLSYLRYGSVTPEAAYHWLKVVSRAYLRVFHTNPPDPSRIFNMDESPMNPAASGQRYVVLKGVAVTKRSSSYREFFTCVVCVSAAGQLAPTLVIMKGKIAQGHWLQEKDARHVVIQAAANDTGMMKGPLFGDWLRKFAGGIAVTPTADKRVILFLDNHSSHVTLANIRLAQSLHIELVALPSNTTSSFQPLDVGVFSPVKHQWQKLLDQ